MPLASDAYQHVFVRSGAEHSWTLLVLHGMGGDERSLLPFTSSIAPEMNILSLKGNVLEQGKTRFYRSGFEATDIVQHVADIQAFCAAASGMYGFDHQRIVALGWSNGANMASLLLLYAPGLLKAAMLFRPLLPPAPPRLPDLHETPVFISGGRHDEVDPPEESKQLSDLLTNSNATVTFRWHKGGHALENDDRETSAKWLQDTLGSV